MGASRRRLPRVAVPGRSRLVDARPHQGHELGRRRRAQGGVAGRDVRAHAIGGTGFTRWGGRRGLVPARLRGVGSGALGAGLRRREIRLGRDGARPRAPLRRRHDRRGHARRPGAAYRGEADAGRRARARPATPSRFRWPRRGGGGALQRDPGVRARRQEVRPAAPRQRRGCGALAWRIWRVRPATPTRCACNGRWKRRWPPICATAPGR